MINTNRLILRPHQIADFEQYANIWMQTSTANINAPNARPLSEEESWARLLRQMGHWSTFGFGPFVVLDGGTKHIVGEAGFAVCKRGISPSFDGAPEAMWRIDVNRQGKGLATEAMLVAASWLDVHQKFPRTVCMIDLLNVASKRVAAKLEFKEFSSALYRDNPVLLFERTVMTVSKGRK
jgi:RimJ/RimL family protein N-acetyltransferase